MRLLALALEGARGVTVKAEMPSDGPLVVTGGAGAGKTAFLEAIIGAKENAGAYGLAPRTRDFLMSGAQAGRVELTFETVSGSAAREKPMQIAWDFAASGPRSLVTPEMALRLRTFSLSPSAWKMEYFPFGRQLCEGGPEAKEASVRLTKLPSKYGFIRRYLEDLVHEEAAEALSSLRRDGLAIAEPDAARSRFTAALRTLRPALRWEGCERTESGRRTWFVRQEGSRVELGHLTDGEKMCVLLAASWTALGLDRSLVLIDHPELGLHPAEHVAFFEGLVALASGGQLIVTTTSPGILRAANPSSIVVLP